MEGVEMECFVYATLTKTNFFDVGPHTGALERKRIVICFGQIISLV